jgi:glycosyltransferase involved in cell wall biosynthesis
MTGRIRIGVVVSSATDGGGEQYLRLLHEGLASRGHESVLFGELPAWDLASVPTGVHSKWSRTSLRQSASRALVDRHRILQTVRRHHQAEPFDLFHLQYKREQVLATRELARLAPVVWTEHGMLPDGRGTSVLRALYRRAGRSVRHVVCVSQSVQGEVGALLPPSTQPVVIPNSVNLARHRPPLPYEREEARARLGVPAAALVLVTASRLHRTKGIALAIEALDHLPPATVLVIAGQGPDRGRLEHLATRRSVVFTGQLTDVSALFQAADVFLLPSTRAAKEGNPIALIEAAAHGLRVVATNDAGIDSQIRAAGGLLATRDPVVFASTILDALNGDGGRIAAAWAQNFDIPQWLDQYELLLTQLRPKAGVLSPD